MSDGTYYLSRVIKMGELDQQRLLDAIVEPPTVEVGKFEWTFTDVMDRRFEAQPYIFANLAKYSQEGVVTVVDEPAKRQLDEPANNLLAASAPFIYLPDFSGLAFLKVWNEIDENVFPRRFQKIVEGKYDEFFVGCEVEPIADYREFLEKVRGFEQISKLHAKVYPPNPLFGRLWRDLDKYVRARQAQSVTVQEVGREHVGLISRLVELLEKVIENPEYEPEVEPSITDAAILMAADGYGVARATGVENGRVVTVKTSGSQLNFPFDKKPIPEELALEVRRQFARISVDRNMRH